VALVITDLDVGGAEKALVNLATGVDRSRWSPEFICLGPEGELVYPLREAGIPVVCLDVKARRPFQALVRLVRELRRQRPLLIQSFLFHANIAVRLAAPFVGHPWIVSGLRVAEREKRWHRLLDRLTSYGATASVCVSQGVLKFSQEHTGLRTERLTVIPNGIDVGLFDGIDAVPRASIGVPEHAHLAIFVGRIEAQKGVDHLLNAASLVARVRPDWYLAIVGDGPDVAANRRRTEQDPLLAERVRWLGRREDVPGLLLASDVLVTSSLWEGMPNVVLEAMAARRAVVGTAVEGTEELIVPGQTGWLVPPGDSDALADALQEAAGDPDRLRTFGEHARERVDAQFSQSRVVEAYETLWARILGLDPEGLNVQVAANRS
jgi:starch synthase (maltosyl-transferring)